MPIIKDYEFEKKKVTAVLFGIGDVHINTCKDPHNAIYLRQDEPKEFKDWRIGEHYKYDGPETPLDELPGEVIYFEFGRVESIDVLIDNLQECRRRMLEVNLMEGSADTMESSLDEGVMMNPENETLHSRKEKLDEMVDNIIKNSDNE